MNGRSPWASDGAGLPWSHPDADPLADMVDHMRRAEEHFRENITDIAARMNAEAYNFPDLRLCLDLTAAEHLAAARDLLWDGARELALAAKVGAREARDRVRRFLDDLPVEL